MRRALLTVVLVGAVCSPALGQSLSSFEEELARPTLKGLPGVFLLINTPSHLVTAHERAGIVTDAELVLRSAGIRLYTLDEYKADPRRPTLLVSFSATAGSKPSNPVGWGTAVELSQAAYLERDPRIYSRAVTWKKAGSFGFGPAASILETAREEVLNGVKLFANAYLAVNPR